MDEDSVSEDMYEYNRPRGRVQVLLHRTSWRWILTGIMALAFGIPFLIVHISPAEDTSTSIQSLSLPQQSLLSSSNSGTGGKLKSVEPSSSSSSTEYKFSGESLVEPLTSFTDFEGLSTQNKTLLGSVILSNVMLDAASFSNSLEGCLNLQQITLENVWLVGNFSRVFLPKLSSFTYIQNGNDKRDSYKSPESLKITLFFYTKNQSSDWSVEQDLLNLGVDISISKGGTKLIDIRRKEGEIYLNVKYCEDLLLNNGNSSFDSLTLVDCNVGNEFHHLIPSTLKYLNLRNSFPPAASLSKLLSKQTRLEEFYGWLTIHGLYENFVTVNVLPPTMKKIGLNNVDWSYDPDRKPSSIKELTVGDFMTESMITLGLPKVFLNLERINIVNVSNPSPASSYKIIEQAIKMKVKEIAVVNLHLHQDYFTLTENLDEVLEIEGILNQAGIPFDMTSCFILQRKAGGEGYTGRQLGVEERHEIRYKGLGFDKMDSLEDYLKWDSLQ